MVSVWSVLLLCTRYVRRVRKNILYCLFARGLDMALASVRLTVSPCVYSLRASSSAVPLNIRSGDSTTTLSQRQTTVRVLDALAQGCALLFSVRVG